MNLGHSKLPVIAQDLLNIENRTRMNLFPWRGQFSPQLVEVLLDTYALKDAFVLDPFVGSGTVLYECGRSSLRAFGAEINPAAATMARTYRFINIEPKERKQILQELDICIQGIAQTDLPLFSYATEHSLPTNVKFLLLEIHSTFAPSDCRDLLETLIILLDFYKRDPTYRDVNSTWTKLKQLVQRLPYSEQNIEVALCDARKLPLENEIVDIVVTSPPYINVFNYHQQYRASTEALGWKILKVAPSEIGSNRKHRNNRFLTIIQYCLDMTEVLIELHRVCKGSALVVLVVGRESNVRKTAFFNGDIIASLATRCAGLHVASRQERVFQNKFGQSIYEDLLYLMPQENERIRRFGNPRSIALEVLKDAISLTPKESLDDLNQAIECVEEVQPSPLFNLSSVNANATVYDRFQT